MRALLQAGKHIGIFSPWRQHLPPFCKACRAPVQTEQSPQCPDNAANDLRLPSIRPKNVPPHPHGHEQHPPPDQTPTSPLFRQHGKAKSQIPIKTDAALGSHVPNKRHLLKTRNTAAPSAARSQPRRSATRHRLAPRRSRDQPRYAASPHCGSSTVSKARRGYS
jgi:hypothetical protein